MIKCVDMRKHGDENRVAVISYNLQEITKLEVA